MYFVNAYMNAWRTYEDTSVQICWVQQKVISCLYFIMYFSINTCIKISLHQVFDYFQLNTPPPVMSACPAPPTCPDPFRSGPYPTRDLGSLTLKVNPLVPSVHPCRVVLQLSQEEDQAITNLLKLHHKEPLQSDETIIAPQMDLNPIPGLHHPEPVESTSAEEVYKPDVQRSGEASFRDQLQQRRCWSNMELEAANTLLSRFSLTEKDNIRGQNHNKSAAALPDPLPYQSQGSGEPGWGGFEFVHGRNADDVHMPVREEYSSVSGDFSEVKERTLSDSEGDAVHVLLSLGDMGALDSMQLLS